MAQTALEFRWHEESDMCAACYVDEAELLWPRDCRNDEIDALQSISQTLFTFVVDNMHLNIER
jgi:hypothetical protein